MRSNIGILGRSILWHIRKSATIHQRHPVTLSPYHREPLVIHLPKWLQNLKEIRRTKVFEGKKMSAKLGFRKLKEQQSRKRIDHPLSKYNNLGQVTCIVCNLPLKNELLWESHLLSRKHKEAVASLKAATNAPQSNLKKPNSVTKISGAPPTKRRKDEESHGASVEKPAHSVVKEEKTTLNRSEGSVQNVLPSDFFDNASNKPTNIDSRKNNPGAGKDIKSPENQSSTSTASTSISEKLPEGFFDDAKMDAKVRKVEYVDKKEEEWEEFQKMIAEETKVSENLQAEEEDEIKVERDLAEYGALKQYLTRVDRLKQKRETHKGSSTLRKENSEDFGDQASEDSEDELEDMLNWRAKKA